MRTLPRLPRLCLLPALLALPLLTRAHEGHGLEGAHHWHATDSVGWIAAAVVVALGVWLSRK